MVLVPEVPAEHSAADAPNPSRQVHFVLAEVLVALVVLLRSHVLVDLRGVLQPSTELVPELGSLHGILDAVGGLLDEPGADHADAGISSESASLTIIQPTSLLSLVVAVEVDQNPDKNANNRSEDTNKGQTGELVYNLHSEEDDGPHHEEE